MIKLHQDENSSAVHGQAGGRAVSSPREQTGVRVSRIYSARATRSLSTFRRIGVISRLHRQHSARSKYRHVGRRTNRQGTCPSMRSAFILSYVIQASATRPKRRRMPSQSLTVEAFWNRGRRQQRPMSFCSSRPSNRVISGRGVTLHSRVIVLCTCVPIEVRVALRAARRYCDSYCRTKSRSFR